MIETAKFRVLVVDDNPAIHGDFRKTLDSGGAAARSELDVLEAELFGAPAARVEACRFEVDTALQGEEALAAVERSMREGRPYAVAFVDGRMPPGWDGIETISRLWRVDAHLQTVLCTAYSDYTWEEITALLGVSDRFLVLKKPFDPIEVRQLAACLSAKWRLARATQSHAADLEQQVRERTRELAETKQWMERVLNSTGEGICGVDRQGTTVFANDAAGRLLGMARGALLGRGFEAIVKPGTGGLTVTAESCRDGRAVHVDDGEFERADGTRLPVAYTTNPIREGDDVVGAVVVFRDLSAARAATAALERSRTLAESARRAQELSKFRLQFVSMVSHELRTPLTAVTAAAEIIERYADRLSAEQRSARLATIRTQAAHMQRLLEDVLTIGRADAGELQCERRPVECVALCRDIIAQVNAAAGTTHRFAVEGPGALEANLDEKLVRQVLTNLLTNAVKYSPAGSNVAIQLAGDNGTTRLTVRDEGIGIPPADLERLFEPFHRGANVGDRPGSGLGLAITKRAVELHGGSLTVASDPSMGTTVSVTLATHGDGGVGA